MQAQIEVITLAFAKQLLEQNPRNRKVTKSVVLRYAADMKAGLWTNNGQGIVLSPEGELLDGQHRMHAIIRSQTPVSMVVVRGVPREVFATIDSGKARSLGDVLGIQGHAHASIVASVVRTAYNYAAGTAYNFQATKAALSEFAVAHPYAIEAAALVHQKTQQFPKIPLATVVFLGNERRLLDKEAAEFVEGVLFGQGLWKGDARLTLREWVAIHRAKGRGTIRSIALFAATARAWNAYAQGRELTVIKCTDKPSRQSLPIFGFERSTYLDVPELAVKVAVRKSPIMPTRPIHSAAEAA